MVTRLIFLPRVEDMTMGTVKCLFPSCLECLQNSIYNGTHEVVGKNETRITYQVVCPHCGYKYSLALYKKYNYEFCPACGYGDSLASFISESKR
jgi:ribosomal protein L37E